MVLAASLPEVHTEELVSGGKKSNAFKKINYVIIGLQLILCGEENPIVDT